MTREEFFNSLNTSTKWDVGVAINRNNPLPLDASSIYESLEALQTYAQTSPTVYVGQFCAVVTDTEVAAYQITKIGEGAEVVKLAATDTSGDIVSDISNLNSKISALEIKVGALETTLGDVENGIVKDVATLQSELNTTKGTVEANTTAIESIESDMATAKADITTVTDLANATKGRVDTLEAESANYATKTEVATAKSEAISEAVKTVLGETVDADFDTLQEIAEWIASDTTNSAQLIARVTNIENDYLKSADKTELNNSISELDTFIGTLPEDAVSTTVIDYIKEVVDALKIGDYAKASELTALSETVSDINTRLGTAENSVASHETKIAALESKTFAVADISGLPEALSGKVDKVEGYTLLSPTDKQKLDRLILNESGGVETGTQVAAGDVQGLAEWLRDNAVANITGLGESNLADDLVTKLNGAIQEIEVDGTLLDEVDGKVTLPLATTTSYGLVKLGAEFELNSDGAFDIKSVNVNKLVQTDGEYLELNGGNATGYNAE